MPLRLHLWRGDQRAARHAFRALAVSLLGLVLLPAAASAAMPDLNGDGFDDLPVPVPFESVAGTSGAGAMHVLYGSAAGLSSAGGQLWHQNSSGVPDACEPGDRFGEKWTWGDFNDDGRDDLVIGVPRESIGTVENAGALHVFYGSPTGLTATGTLYLHQNRSGILEACEPGDLFGSTLAAGDYNGDGFADLAVTARGESVGPQPGAGAVQVFYGSAGGLQIAGNQFWSQNRAGIPDAAEPGDEFGSTLLVANFNGDSHQDLLIGVPGEDIGAVPDAGAIQILAGSAAGLTSNGAGYFNQSTSGIADNPEADERFGERVAAGDFNGDGRDDLAIGVPTENPQGITEAGAVHVLYSSANGLGTAGSQFWHQNAGNVAGLAEPGDRFGFTVAAADTEDDGFDDLILGVPFDDLTGIINVSIIDAGLVQVLPGSATGVGTNRQTREREAGLGTNVAEPGDHFGYSLVAADFSGDSRADIMVGVPADSDHETPNEAGSVSTVYGITTGTAGPFVEFKQGSEGMLDSTEANDNFGLLLSSGDFNGDVIADLVVPLPAEDIGPVEAAGAVHVVYGSSNGLTTTGNQFWHQDSPGIAEVAEPFDRFADGDWR